LELLSDIILGLLLGYYLWRNQTGGLALEFKSQELARVISERDALYHRLTEAEKVVAATQEAKSAAERSLNELKEIRAEIEKDARYIR
jgi:hypothetical protein